MFAYPVTTIRMQCLHTVLQPHFNLIALVYARAGKPHFQKTPDINKQIPYTVFKDRRISVDNIGRLYVSHMSVCIFQLKNLVWKTLSTLSAAFRADALFGRLLSRSSSILIRSHLNSSPNLKTIVFKGAAYHNAFTIFM